MSGVLNFQAAGIEPPSRVIGVRNAITYRCIAVSICAIIEVGNYSTGIGSDTQILRLRISSKWG